MESLKIPAPASFIHSTHTQANTSLNLWGRYLAYADSHKQKHTMLFIISLMVQGVFFLPLPAVLMYYCNASIIVLAITMVTFFGNLIVNMSGAGIRTTMLFFGITVIIHVLMVLICTL